MLCGTLKRSLCFSWARDQHMQGEKNPAASVLLLSPLTDVIYCTFQKHPHAEDSEAHVHFCSILLHSAADHFIEIRFRQLYHFNYLFRAFILEIILPFWVWLHGCA
jgi:hypothetical protein